MRRLALERHDDQQVHVGILCRCSVGIRPEQDNAVRVKLAGDALAEFFNLP